MVRLSTLMDIFFQGISEIPLPMNQLRIRELRARVLRDHQRVKVYYELEPAPELCTPLVVDHLETYFEIMQFAE